MEAKEQHGYPTDLQAVVNNAALIIWAVDAQGLITMAEGRGLQDAGLSSGQLVGKSLFEMYSATPEAIGQVKRVLAGETSVAEAELSGRVLETHYSPVKNETGVVTGAVGVSTDITKRWSAEQLHGYLLKLSDALRPLSDPQMIKTKAMQVLGEYLNVSRCYYAEVTEDGEHCVIDNSFHAGLGGIDGRYRLSDFGKTRVATLKAGENIIAEDVANDMSVSQSERDMNLMMQIHAYINVPLVKDQRLICMLGINQSSPRNWTALDLNLVRETAERTWAAVERGRAEIRVQRNEKQFKDIIEAIPQLVWVCNSIGEAIYFNKPWYEFTDTRPGDTSGHKWMGLLHPDDVAVTQEKWTYAQQTATALVIEYRLRKSGGEYRWVLSHGVPILDSDGHTERWFGTCTDIHERKHFARSLEEKVAERTKALKESNRLLARSNEELKQFAYVSSHDLQEPLRKIQTFSAMALEHIDDADMLTTYLKKIGSSASRMSSLIKDLLQFSKVSDRVQDFELVDMN